MSLILRSDKKSTKRTGSNAFNIPRSLDDALAVLDFSSDTYLVKGSDGLLSKKKFSEVVDYSRTGYTEAYSKHKGWYVVEPDTPALHFDNSAKVGGLLQEGAVASAEQIINRQGADVIPSESITTTYRSSFIWLMVRGTGSVTVSGNIQSRNAGGLVATEQTPLFLEFINNGSGSSVINFAVAGDVSAYSMVRVGGNDSFGGRVPYVNKSAYLSRGITNISLTENLKALVNSQSTYTVIVDIAAAYGTPYWSGGVRVGKVTANNTLVSYSTAGIKATTRTPTAEFETLTTLRPFVGMQNTVLAVTVKNNGAIVTATNSLSYATSTKPTAITDFDLSFIGQNQLIRRIAIFPQDFTENELRDIVAAWYVPSNQV